MVSPLLGDFFIALSSQVEECLCSKNLEQDPLICLCAASQKDKIGQKLWVVFANTLTILSFFYYRLENLKQAQKSNN